MDFVEINQTYYEQILNGTKNYSDIEVFDEDDLLYEPPTEVIVLLSIFYGTISVLAVFGNILVIWIVATTRQMQTITNFFIANLAFADVVIGMFAIPFEFQAALLQRWNLPEFMCPFCPFIQLLSVNVSVFTLTAIAIDRHRAILNPLRARPSKCIAKLIIATIWLLSLVLACPITYAMRVIDIKRIIEHDGVKRMYSKPFCKNINLSDGAMLFYRYTLGVAQYIIPLSVISFVYIQMALRLWGSKTPGNAQNARDITLLKNKKKVIKMLIVVVFLFAMCWLPIQTYNVLQAIWPEINEYQYINIIWFCSNFFAMSNSCYNPFIYAIYNEKFKREYRRRFPFCRWLGFRDYRTNGISGYTDYEKTTSMHTRGTSLRSNYPGSSIRIKDSKFNNVSTHTQKPVKSSSSVTSPTSDNVDSTTYKCNCFTQTVKPEPDAATMSKQKGSHKLANSKKYKNSENNQTKTVNYCNDCQCQHQHHRKLSSIKDRRNGGKSTCDKGNDNDNDRLINRKPTEHHTDCVYFMRNDESETLM